VAATLNGVGAPDHVTLQLFFGHGRPLVAQLLPCGSDADAKKLSEVDGVVLLITPAFDTE